MAIAETVTVCPVPCARLRLVGLTVSEKLGVLSVFEPVLGANILPPQPHVNPATAKKASEHSHMRSLPSAVTWEFATSFGDKCVTVTSRMFKSFTARGSCTDPEVTPFVHTANHKRLRRRGNAFSRSEPAPTRHKVR